MSGFLSDMLGYVQTIWTFVLGLIQSLLMAIKYLLTGTDAILYLAGVLPSVIGGIVIAFFFIYIVKFLIGR